MSPQTAHGSLGAREDEGGNDCDCAESSAAQWIFTFTVNVNFLKQILGYEISIDSNGM